MVAEAGAAGVRGVLHCFTGPRALAETALGVGLVRFVQRHRDVQEVGRRRRSFALVPDDRLLVESDSPYLAPVPNRGRRNEPAWVSFTVARVAAARGVEPATLAPRRRATPRDCSDFPSLSEKRVVSVKIVHTTPMPRRPSVHTRRASSPTDFSSPPARSRSIPRRAGDHRRRARADRARNEQPRRGPRAR